MRYLESLYMANNYNFTILGTALWCPESCKRAGQSIGAAFAQITNCYADKSDVLYVRENIDGGNSFYASSGERWGWKTHGRISKRYQILELCADENKDYILHLVNRVVDQYSLQRKIVWNRKFTTEWCQDFVYH